MTKELPDAKGHFGPYGGRYVPETLVKACEELTGLKAAEVLGSDDQWKPLYPLKRAVLADMILDGSFDDLPSLYGKVIRSPLTPDGFQSDRVGRGNAPSVSDVEPVKFGVPPSRDSGTWYRLTASPESRR